MDGHSGPSQYSFQTPPYLYHGPEAVGIHPYNPVPNGLDTPVYRTSSQNVDIDPRSNGLPRAQPYKPFVLIHRPLEPPFQACFASQHYFEPLGNGNFSPQDF